MRTANNTNNYTVEGLVAKYRNFVMNHASYELIGAEDDGLGSAEYGLDGWPDHQLLITLYNDVAGTNADSKIKDRLSKFGDYYWKDVLSVEEYAFLRNNFKETVAFIFSKCLWYGSDSLRDIVYLKMSDISFIGQAAKCVTAKPGDCIYLENDTFGDGAMLFPQCVILCDDKDDDEFALKKIRLFASGIQYKHVDKIEEETIDIIISGSRFFSIPSETLYATLANNGTMVMQAHLQFLAGNEKDAAPFRKLLVADKTIKSVIKYSESKSFFRYIMVIEKKDHSEVDIQDRISQQSKKVGFEQITAKILLPGYYLTEKPKNGVPLSDFLDNYDFNHVKQDVSIEQPMILPNNLGCTFKDANISLKSFKKGTEYGLTSDNPASNCYNVDFPSILLYGGTKNIYAGITPKTDFPYAVLDYIACFTAKEGVNLRYVASLLFDPIVAKQISAIYQDFCYGNMMQFLHLFLHSIIVPNNNPNQRNKYLADACFEALYNVQVELKQEKESCIKAVRMRKHALTQSLSSVKSMFNALNNYRNLHKGNISDNEQISRVKGTTVKEAFEFIDKNIKDIMPALEHIADVEYSFNKPEWIDPERFVEDYITKKGNGWLNFKPNITWENGHNQAKGDLKDPFTGQLILKKGDAVNMLLFPTDALERVFNNIVSNAQAHGFTDNSRKDYELRFSWHTDGIALIVEIENNGTAISSDRDTASLLEYGVSSALHQNGHNGIGCNEIDDIMRRYDGKVEIVSSPKNEFTVKYVLTFNRSNIVKSFIL